MGDWLRRINIFWTFVLLLVFHLLLYGSLRTPNWLYVALAASVFDTAVIAGAKALMANLLKGK
jgi:hypothetical protein